PNEYKRYVEYAGEIHTAGQHLLSLINDILDLSKIVAGKDEIEESEVNMAQVAEWAVKLTKERIQKGKLTCVINRDTKTCRVRADLRRMRQVMVNILSNAIKFTPAGGTITITVWNHFSGGLAISVKDTGIGIAKADIARALAPFEQVDRGRNRKQHEGTGLGLSLTKSIVELHQGTLALESEVDVGTTVTFILPPERMLVEQSIFADTA